MQLFDNALSNTSNGVVALLTCIALTHHKDKV